MTIDMTKLNTSQAFTASMRDISRVTAARSVEMFGVSRYAVITERVLVKQQKTGLDFDGAWSPSQAYLCLVTDPNEQLMLRFSRKCHLFLIPRLSFPSLLRVRKLRWLDSNSDAPSESVIHCFRGTTSLLSGSKIDEKIAMIPSACATKGWCSRDDDLTNSLTLIRLVLRGGCWQKEQYAHVVPFKKHTDIGIDCMVVWHARQSSNE